ncbi:MerR family transcriptional regulator [Phytomonospora endophytica]|uniref:DNA-binding transcriptional MerR regulator n=1 Tax=Phytomonospora endophytica TaxID=714109 RepID=A0A841FGY1_9ACTN|nr:MerR family transcriptional regulator [Phytomonospora endophytica]MBB6034253.1 DNA-binding transcriptional MerR regulator [Phytomonospora endophytica]GIG66645.1 MerR family transcriptional regulator [Phytomonospora endophytica]
MHEPHLLAGRFGAATRLSPKALRLYAEQGLLVPARVDPSTGYRYYHPAQVHRARLISRLRRLDLPLARIAVLLDLTPEARESELRAWLRARQEEIGRHAVIIDAITRGGAESPELAAAVRVRAAAETKLLSRQRLLHTDSLDAFVAEADARIRAHLRAAGLPGEGPTRVYFHDLVTPDSEGLVEVAVAYEGSVEPTADLRIRVSPAQSEAFLPAPPDHEDFPLVLRLYDAVESWIDERPGVECADTCFEVWPGTGARFDVVYPVTEP